MRNTVIAAVLVAGLGFGSVAGVYAKLPAAPAKTDAEKSADAAKAAAAKAKGAEANAKAEERAVANYKKNKGMPMEKPAMAKKASAKK